MRMNDAKEIIEEIEKEEEINETTISFQVQQHLFHKQRSKASELIVKAILFYERIYTTRDDDKPEMWIYKEGIYIPQAKTYIKEYCIKLLDYMFTTTICNEVIQKIEARTYIEQDKFFEVKDPYKFAVENGVINLKNQELIPFSPDHFLFNKLPVKYDKEATCPNIIKFFKSIFINEQDIQLMQEIMGFILLKDYKFEKAIMFHGTGRNGKGKTIELIKRFIGIENISSVPLQELQSDTYSKGELHNKLANIGGDISSDSLKETSDFKGLTGHDLIAANRKYKTRLHFVNYAKLIFSCNTFPMTYDHTIAFFNRWILISFPFSFLNEEELNDNNLIIENTSLVKKPDPEIINKISTPEELSGLLNWSLEGYRRLMKRKNFSYDVSSNEIAKIWMRKSNSLVAFCMDYIEADYEGKIVKKHFRKAYSDYCKEHRIKALGDKGIKEYLSREFGVGEDRYREECIDYLYWDGIKFRGIDKDDRGFSPYSKKKKNGIGSKTHGTLPKYEKHIENQEELNDLLLYLETNPKNNAVFVDEHFSKDFLEKLKREGTIFENPKGTYKVI